VTESIELATILLTDLVGSTRLATTVGPAAADALREEHFSVLREAIESSGGREAKNTGDGLMVAFSSASAAVRCAVLIQQQFERRYRRASHPLHVRIGMGAGESTVKDGDYFGMPSIEAARLCDKAPPDGILVSSLVTALAGRTEGISFESVGLLELKGFKEPVEAFAVPWAPLAAEAGGLGRWRLPAALRSLPTLSYVGRELERAQIEEERAAVREGARRLMLISGEPGIGKSRLAAYAAHGAHGEGFGVCWGACSEELGVPYEPWIEVCQQIVDSAPTEALETYVEHHGGEVSRLARNLARRVPDAPAPQSSDPETERFLLFSAVAGLVRAVSEQVPLCLVLDDLHWADGQSVALLKHVTRTVEHGPLQLIGTYRDSDLGKDHALTGVLADLRRIEGVQRISLHGLGVDAVAEMLTAIAGHELDGDGVELAGEIAAETDGNPFFVGEILRSLQESGTFVLDEATGRWRVDRSSGLGLPQSVRDVIERRVDRLGDAARDVLTLAAVVGRSFEVELLAQLVDMGEGRLLDELDAAVGASLLAESTEQIGLFRFTHALINQTLYAALGTTRRARMHHRVAQALEELVGDDPGDRLGELAFHWRMATAPVDRGKAAEYARRAGQQALERLAPAEAARLFADALDLLAEGATAERCRVLIGLGEAQLLTGAAEYRETLLEAAEIASTLGDAELAASAALANNRGIASAVGDVDSDRLAAIERATELDDGSQPVRRARLLALRASELAFDPNALERRRALVDEAIPLARAGNDARIMAEVLRNSIQALWSPDTLARRVEVKEELHRCATEAQDPAIQWWAVHTNHAIGIELGRVAEAEAALHEQRQLAGELDHPTLNWLCNSNDAAFAVLRGDLAAADRWAERALHTGTEAGHSDALLLYGAQLGFLRTYQGRAEEIVALLEQGVAAYSGVPAFRAGLANVYCWLGRAEEGAVIVQDAATDRFEHVPWDPVRMTTLALYSDAASQSGCTGAAAILYELLEPWSDQIVWTDANCYGHAQMWLGLVASILDQPELTDRHLEFACQFQEENGLPLWAARAHLGWAEALARRGDGARAHEQAARALELARAGGYVLIEARAAAIVAVAAAAGS
jgi:class 3 adenylate cyclase